MFGLDRPGRGPPARRRQPPTSRAWTAFLYPAAVSADATNDVRAVGAQLAIAVDAVTFANTG